MCLAIWFIFVHPVRAYHECSSSSLSATFFFLINLFIYLFLAALGLHCSEWGLLFVVVCRLLIAVASLVEEHGL